MDYEKMSIDELKEYARSLEIKFGNIGREKLIEKIKEKESLDSVINDNDLENDAKEDIKIVDSKENIKNSSLLNSISSAIDDLEEAENDELTDETVSLSLDESIAVKSITFGGLTYKSRTTNAIFRWNNIGSVEYMTVSELNEMNNYKRDFLNRPLVILLDERAIKKFRLTQVYENVAKINNLKAVFNSDMQTIERTIDNALRVNMRDILISKVRQMIKNKTLVDVGIIKMLEKKLQYDLMDTIE